MAKIVNYTGTERILHLATRLDNETKNNQSTLKDIEYLIDSLVEAVTNFKKNLIPADDSTRKFEGYVCTKEDINYNHE